MSTIKVSTLRFEGGSGAWGEVLESYLRALFDEPMHDKPSPERPSPDVLAAMEDWGIDVTREKYELYFYDPPKLLPPKGSGPGLRFTIHSIMDEELSCSIEWDGTTIITLDFGRFHEFAAHRMTFWRNLPGVVDDVWINNEAQRYTIAEAMLLLVTSH